MGAAAAQQIRAEVAEISARVAVLRRELGMLRNAHAHLSGIPARHNALRIAERESELDTLRLTLELYGRDDAAEVEAAALAEGSR